MLGDLPCDLERQTQTLGDGCLHLVLADAPLPYGAGFADARDVRHEFGAQEFVQLVHER